MDKYFTENKSQGDEEFFDPENRTENLSFSEHMHEMKTGEKAKYIKDYVLLPVLVVLFLAGFIAIVVYLQYRDRTVDVFYVHICEPETVNKEAVSDLSKTLYEKMGLVRGERIYFDTMPYNEEEELQLKKTQNEAETIRQYAGVRNNPDICIGTPEDFKEDYENGRLYLIDEIITQETLNAIKGQTFVYKSMSGIEKERSKACAFVLTESLYKDCLTEDSKDGVFVLVFYKTGEEKEDYKERANALVRALFGK